MPAGSPVSVARLAPPARAAGCSNPRFSITAPSDFFPPSSFGIILHGREGRISELEVYPVNGEGTFTLPDIEEIGFYGAHGGVL